MAPARDRVGRVRLRELDSSMVGKLHLDAVVRRVDGATARIKPVTPVVRSVEDAGIARRVARLWPLVTVKG